MTASPRPRNVPATDVQPGDVIVHDGRSYRISVVDHAVAYSRTRGVPSRSLRQLRGRRVFPTRLGTQLHTITVDATATVRVKSAPAPLFTVVGAGHLAG